MVRTAVRLTPRGIAGVAAIALTAGILVQPLLTVGFVLAVLAAYVIVRWPYVALVAFFALVPFHFLGFELATSKLGVGVGPLVYWKEALLVGLLARGAWMRLLDGRFLDTVWTGANQLLIGYVLVLIVWIPMSPFISPAVTSFIRTAEGPLMIIMVLSLLPSRRVVMACLIAVVGGAIVFATAGIIEQRYPGSFQKWYGFNTSSEVFWAHPLDRTGYRSGSFFGDSLVFGFWLSGVTSLAVGLYLLVRGRARLVVGAIVLLCLGATITTYTRSAYVAVPLGVVITVGLALDRTKVRNAALGMAAIGVICVLGGLYFSGSGRLEHADSSENHFDLLTGAFDQSTEHPLGFGLGTTDFVAHRYNVQYYVGQSVDSVFGDRLVEGGPLILGLYVVSLASVAVRLYRARRVAIAVGDRMAMVLCACTLGAFIAVAAAGVFLPVQEQPVTATAWGAAGLALAVAVGRSHPTRDDVVVDNDSVPLLRA